jgi:tripeptidyl-peptidase-1
LLGPFVTAVGGTTGVNPEKAASLSGGGFSNYFARPSYQNTTVANYLTSIGTKNHGFFKYVPGFRYANSLHG